MPSPQAPAVLVFRSAALGDFILATPALLALRQAFPGQRIVLLTIQSAMGSLRAQVSRYTGTGSPAPWVELAMPHLVDEAVFSNDLTSLRGVLAVRRQLAGLRFDAAVMLVDPAAPWAGRLKKWLMLKMVSRGAPVLGWRGRGSLNGDRPALQRAGVLRHHVHGPLQFLAELHPPKTYRDDQVRFDLRPDADAVHWAATWARAPGRAGRCLVAFAPGAIQAHKCWPLAHYQALLRALLAARPEAAFVVVGTRGDAERGQALAALAPQRVFSLAGETSIAQSAALLAHCALLVGNDGGAMHLGDAMGTRVVSIVPGLEYPDSIEPWHNRHRAVRHPVPCAPCYSFTSCPQGHNRCMLELPVDAVLQQCLLALSEAEAAATAGD